MYESEINERNLKLVQLEGCILYLVIFPRALGLRYDGVECVGEIFEQHVLLFDVHAQDPIEELGHVVVSLVQSQRTGHVLRVGDQTHPNQTVGNV